MLTEKVIRFFQHQHLTIVSTIDKDGHPHNSCKGIVDIGKDGTLYLMDLYKGHTYQNLKLNPKIGVTVVDEHKFVGFTLKGTAKIVRENQIGPRLIKAWDKRLATRITQRLLKEMRGERGHHHHTEALLPTPEYLIAVKVKEVVDLTPHHLKGDKNETKGN